MAGRCGFGAEKELGTTRAAEPLISRRSSGRALAVDLAVDEREREGAPSSIKLKTVCSLFKLSLYPFANSPRIEDSPDPARDSSAKSAREARMAVRVKERELSLFFVVFLFLFSWLGASRVNFFFSFFLSPLSLSFSEARPGVVNPCSSLLSLAGARARSLSLLLISLPDPPPLLHAKGSRAFSKGSLELEKVKLRPARSACKGKGVERHSVNKVFFFFLVLQKKISLHSFALSPLTSLSLFLFLLVFLFALPRGGSFFSFFCFKEGRSCAALFYVTSSPGLSRRRQQRAGKR